MKQKVANYTVIIEKEKRTGSDEICFTAFAPLLGIATEAETIEQAQQVIQSLIQFHIDSLREEGEEIPIEQGNSFVTKTEVYLPEGAILASNA